MQQRGEVHQSNNLGKCEVAECLKNLNALQLLLSRKSTNAVLYAKLHVSCIQIRFSFLVHIAFEKIG